MSDREKNQMTKNSTGARLIMSTFLTTLFWFLLSYDFFAAYQIILLLLFLFSIIFLIRTISNGIRKRQHPPIWTLITCSVLVILMPLNYCYRNGIFWGKKILEAAFLDERSRMDLTLFENEHFLINSNWLFGDETFTGTYHLRGDTIKFEKFPVVDNDFISQEVIIKGTKIYFAKDKFGNYDTTFYYFQIDITRKWAISSN